MSNLRIRSQRVLLNGKLQPATLLVQEGVIRDILPFDTVFDDAEVFDAGDAVVMPGVIDAHVHVNEPGRTEWEGFDTATRAAAAGGTTTIVDMPLNSTPVTTTADAFLQKLDASAGKTHVHCGFWGGLVPDNAQDLSALMATGVLGLKAFLVHSGIDDFPNVDEEDLRAAMPQIAAADLPLLAHCELERETPFEWQNAGSYADWLASRPGSMEYAATEMMRDLAAETGCRTHVVHVSDASLVPMLQAARAAGIPVSWETCAHYLYFHAEAIPDGSPAYKCAPPIRALANQDALWQHLAAGEIDFVTTDHSPASPDVKCLDSGDLQKAWGGIHGIQFLLQATWTMARQKGIDIPQMARWLCSGPAEFIGHAGRKGKIAVGYDADLVVWDPEKVVEIRPENVHFRHAISPYIGQELHGHILRTYVGGQLVFDEGKFVNLGAGDIILRH